MKVYIQRIVLEAGMLYADWWAPTHQRDRLELKGTLALSVTGDNYAPLTYLAQALNDALAEQVLQTLGQVDTCETSPAGPRPPTPVLP